MINNKNSRQTYLEGKYFENLDAADNSTNIATTKFVKGNPSTAKAWVNFNGTGTVAIRSSYNVSSITDNGVGNYTVNFSTPMSNVNFATFVLGRQLQDPNENAYNARVSRLYTPNINNVAVVFGYYVAPSNAYVDMETCSILIFGN